jgi:hypothetical protein
VLIAHVGSTCLRAEQCTHNANTVRKALGDNICSAGSLSISLELWQRAAVQ